MEKEILIKLEVNVTLKGEIDENSSVDDAFIEELKQKLKCSSFSYKIKDITIS